MARTSAPRDAKKRLKARPMPPIPPTIATFIPLRSKLRASTRRQTKFLSRLVNITVLLSLPPQQGGFRQSRQPDGDLRLGEAACCNDLKRKNHSHVELTNGRRLAAIRCAPARSPTCLVSSDRHP